MTPNAGVLTLICSCPGPPRGREADAGAACTIILPGLTLAEAIETKRIHSVAALTGANLGSAPPMTPLPLRA